MTQNIIKKVKRTKNKERSQAEAKRRRNNLEYEQAHQNFMAGVEINE